MGLSVGGDVGAQDVGWVEERILLAALGRWFKPDASLSTLY